MPIIDTTADLLAQELRFDAILRSDLDFDSTLETIIRAISEARDESGLEDEIIAQIMLKPMIGALASKIAGYAPYAAITRKINPMLEVIDIYDIILEVIGDLFD